MIESQKHQNKKIIKIYQIKEQKLKMNADRMQLFVRKKMKASLKMLKLNSFRKQNLITFKCQTVMEKTSAQTELS